jgi:thioredoxin reductase
MRSTELAIIGAGPSGLSAAIEAAKAGVRVVLIDENERPGGQLFKQTHKFFGTMEHYAGIRGIDIGERLLRETEELGVSVLLNTVAWGIFDNNVIGLIQNEKGTQLRAERILLATGAMENSLPFPGWTLPGVMGAGAVQTLMNIQRVLPGKRAVMVGAGNVGLIVSYHLLQAGAQVVKVVEAKPEIGGWGVHASKIARFGVPIETSMTIKRAEGKERVERAVLVKLDENWKEIPGPEEVYDVDMICLAVGLGPMTDLAWIAGCRFHYIEELGGYIPVHDEFMETTIKGIYVAGDSSGIEEASIAIEEGRLAGTAIAGSLGHISGRKAGKRTKEIQKRIGELRETAPVTVPLE